MGEQAQQGVGGIGDGAPARLSLRRGELGGHPALRAAVVEEGRVEVEHDVAAVAHDEPADRR